MVATASRKSSSENLPKKFSSPYAGKPWDKKMSNNAAFALLTYTLLQIFVVMTSIETRGMSIAPYFGLLVLVAIIIPFCRKYERRWQNMHKFGLSEQSLASKFRKDQIVLWLLATTLPVVFLGIYLFVMSLI